MYICTHEKAFFSVEGRNKFTYLLKTKWRHSVCHFVRTYNVQKVHLQGFWIHWEKMNTCCWKYIIIFCWMQKGLCLGTMFWSEAKFDSRRVFFVHLNSFVLHAKVFTCQLKQQDNFQRKPGFNLLCNVEKKLLIWRHLRVCFHWSTYNYYTHTHNIYLSK
jgi:hypothetical protein